MVVHRGLEGGGRLVKGLHVGAPPTFTPSSHFLDTGWGGVGVGGGGLLEPPSGYVI